MNTNQMMSYATIPFGLLELDAAGNVINYSPAKEQNPTIEKGDIVGRNFFKDVVPVTEVGEFKSRFLAFMAYGDSVQRFTIRFPFERETIKVQIILARMSERSDLGHERLALVRLMPDAAHGATA
ncbi:MAG TPA: hypothetical protein VNA19_16500 [Pyrinomonadaceae bacterium]|jgi:photoactive yellow protein|nr:hypothetical protein [Pyrinomonadaceae bacterium]